MTSVADIEKWLQELQRSATAIRSAGLHSGARQAGKLNLRSMPDVETLHVAPKGKTPMGSIPVAIKDGMLAEFERRAR